MSRWRFAFFAAVLLLFSSPRATAQDAHGPGLDLLVLVDRSGSMTSKEGRRVDHALLGLAVDVVGRSARSARVHHRFGVLSFGSKAHVDVPLTLADPASIPALQRRLASIDPRRSHGNTDFIAAFAAAADVFRGLPADARRRRAILLITDGHVHVPGMRAGEVARDLRRLIDARLSMVTIDVMLSGAETPFWRRITRGRVHRVGDDRGDVVAALHRIVADAVGTRSVQTEIAGASETLILPPYLDFVVFDIFRGAPGMNVAVFSPGSPHPLDVRSAGVEELLLGDVICTIVIRRPAAGAWTFRKSLSTARVKVLSQQFFPRGMLVDPIAVRQHDQVTIAYRIHDGEGRILRELAAHPLSLRVSLVTPDGRRMVLPMKRGARDPRSWFRATAATQCDLAGWYWTEVLVSTADATGRTVRVFEDRWSGFAAEAAERIDCRITAHAAESRIRVECLDLRSRPADLQLLAHAASSPFEPLLLRNGKQLRSPISLQYLGRGVFEGTLPATTSTGYYELRLAIDPNRLPPTLNIRVDPPRLTFIRRSSLGTAILRFAALAALSALSLILFAVLRR